MPTWGARLHVANHVVGVVFEGHNDVGDRWVHGPSLMGILCPTKRFFYSFFSVSNPPQPGIRLNIRWTRLLLAAICAALILPTFFFFFFFMRTAAATAAGMRSGRMPPRCFRRRFRCRGPQCMMICPMEDTPWVFYSFHMMEQLKDSPAYFFRLPEATSRRRFSPMAMARLV